MLKFIRVIVPVFPSNRAICRIWGANNIAKPICLKAKPSGCMPSVEQCMQDNKTKK